MSGQTAMQEVLATFAEHARSGEPLDDGIYSCGLCRRETADGVRMYVVEIRQAGKGSGGRDLVDYQYRLVCPCCSTTDRCEHRAAAGWAD